MKNVWIKNYNVANKAELIWFVKKFKFKGIDLISVIKTQLYLFVN